MNLLNHAVLDDLREMLSATELNDLLRQVVKAIEADSPTLAALALSPDSGDLEQAAVIAHRLKGMAGHFGCTALVDALGQMEDGLRASSFCQPTPVSVRRISALARETATELKRLLAGWP